MGEEGRAARQNGPEQAVRACNAHKPGKGARRYAYHAKKYFSAGWKKALGANTAGCYLYGGAVGLNEPDGFLLAGRRVQRNFVAVEYNGNQVIISRRRQAPEMERLR